MDDVVALLLREGLVDEGARASLAGRGVVALVDDGVVADDALADVLAREAGTVVIDLDRGTLDREAVKSLPGAIARRCLAVAVALEPGGRALRVAFANPLDGSALRDVAESTGRSVRALCAPLRSVRRALDREYGGEGPTKQVALPSTRKEKEIQPEPTRRLAALDARGKPLPSTSPTEPSPPTQPERPAFSEPEEGTMPVHRLEQEATIEQRHEALLLALVERGYLTRADYTDALKRLLGRRER